MIPTDLFEFAYVPDWYRQLDELAAMVLPESWQFKKLTAAIKNTDTPIFFTGIVTDAMKKSKHTESGGLSSKAGWFGLSKKICTLMLIAVTVRIDILLETTYIRDAVCISFCLNKLLSIVENTVVCF